jgi:chromosome segregation ATPase
MSRGRHDNRVCVVTDAATTGHGHESPPTPVEVLAAVMRRSSAELSATETLRQELDRGEDRETLRRLHEQAIGYIEAHAGPDRRPELRRLQQIQSTLPTMRNRLAVNQRDVARFDSQIARIRYSFADDEAHLGTLTRRRRFRRPDHHAIDTIQHRINTQQRYLERLQEERARATADLERSRSRLRDAERSVNRIPDVEAAIQHRRDWILSHPAELAWEADLAARLADSSRTTEPPTPDHEQSVSDLDDVLASIDLRTIDLSPGRRRTGLERHLDDALGVTRPDDPIDQLLRPPPGRGIDGPDLGFGL